MKTLTLTLLTWTKWRAPTNASKWRMGFNSAFKGLMKELQLNVARSLEMGQYSDLANIAQPDR